MNLIIKSEHVAERSIYPNTVFHFTDNIECLKSIIQSQYFKASYAKEVIVGHNTKRTFGIPMVSFCDIRLSNLYEHMEKYGYYGIGLRKSWAINNGLNPVSYLNQKCSMFTYFDEQLREMSEELLDIKPLDEYKIAKSKYRNLLNVMRYMKNYEGELKRKNIYKKNYRYANESEWRYVPDISTNNVIPVKLIKENEPNWKDKANKHLSMSSSSRLGFDIKDIKYILIPGRSDTYDFIEHLADDKNKIEIISKIFDSSQIYKDL